MDWLESRLEFNTLQGSVSFSLIHFDSVDFPIVPNSVRVPFDASLEPAESELGSVLWLDAVNLFLPYLANDLITTTTQQTRALCLGEGTGACGCGIASFFSESIVISDLGNLLPLLERNAKLDNSGKIFSKIIDWSQPSNESAPVSAIIGCEVLYGNRFVWPDLLNTIVSYSDRATVIYLCVTLRNARHDIDDFNHFYLSTKFENISEISLSANVSVLRATHLVTS